MISKIKKNRSLNIAVRGYGNHCKKLLKAFEALGYTFDLVLLPRSVEAWKDIGEKDQIDACLITSPNSTHVSYAEAAINLFRSAHVYCEKPFVNHIDDLKKAHDLIETGRITLGFNLRYSILEDTINGLIEQYGLGPIIGIEISVCYPFALRDSYSGSWKSSPIYSPLGVVENLAVHYIDFVNYMWNVKSIFESSSVNVDSLPTTTNIIAKLGNGATVNMHFSYSESYLNHFILNLKGGKIVIDENASKIFAPVLNVCPTTSMSIPPRLVHSDENGMEKIFASSLVSAMKCFVGRINREPNDFNNTFRNSQLKDHEYIDIMGDIVKPGRL